MDLNKFELPDLELYEENAEGEFKRRFKDCTDFIGEGKKLPAEKNRYYLFVSHVCPWSHKNVISRKVKGLEDIIGLTFMSKHSEKHGRGWLLEEGPDCLKDLVHSDGHVYLKDLYQSISHLVVRPTTPTLYDTKTNRVVSNHDERIQEMFNKSFDKFLEPKYKSPQIDLFPPEFAEGMKKLSPFLYENVNDGVYRCGFATGQPGYEKSVRRLFIALDWLDHRLSKTRYLFGNDVITDCDWRLYVTILRFDIVYYTLFKCNIRRIRDYENLYGWLKDLYQVEGVKGSVGLEKVKKGYFSLTYQSLSDRSFGA